MPIFKQFHKFIIGKSGATIKEIRKETNTKIDLPESGSDSDVITITGKKENVEKAQDQITKIQSEMANVISVDLIIPAKIHNTMIGAGGKLIQSISDDCGGVAIKFPPSNSNSDKVKIFFKKIKGQLITKCLFGVFLQVDQKTKGLSIKDVRIFWTFLIPPSPMSEF